MTAHITHCGKGSLAAVVPVVKDDEDIDRMLPMVHSLLSHAASCKDVTDTEDGLKRRSLQCDGHQQHWEKACKKTREAFCQKITRHKCPQTWKKKPKDCKEEAR